MRRMTLTLALALATTTSLAPPASALKTDIDFLIKRGEHRDSTPGSGPKALKIGRKERSVSFRALFTSSAAYRVPGQTSWNKLMGISSNRIRQLSLRLGWAYDPSDGKMALGFYAYRKGDRIMEPLTKVPLNAWVDVTVRLGPRVLSIQAGGAKVEKTGDTGMKALTSTWILQTAYFGGNDKAPQEITVQVRSVRAR
jgi:hypothetical protein